VGSWEDEPVLSGGGGDHDLAGQRGIRCGGRPRLELRHHHGFAAAFGTTAKIWALFVYALVVTMVGVVVIVMLGRLAARIKAQPIEFKYPGIPKS